MKKSTSTFTRPLKSIAKLATIASILAASFNVFAEPIGRFSEIEEDVDAIHLLVSDYEKWGLI